MEILNFYKLGSTSEELHKQIYMINESLPCLPATPLDRGDFRRLPSLCWKAILGGTFFAMGLHILLTMLGVGAGLAIFSPITDANPISHFNVGAAIVWSLCALVALWFGAVLAGRFSHSLHQGFVHGLLVWSLTLIITGLIISGGAGMILSGGMKILGDGMGAGAKALTSAVGDVAKDGLKQTGAQLGSFTDEAVQSIPTNSSPKAATRARREVGFAVAQLLCAPENSGNFSANRAAVIQALQVYTQMSEADAAATVDGWVASANELRSELDKAEAAAKQKAREAADQAARNLSCVAIWSFFALLLGLMVTALGGSYGARHALRHLEAAGTRR